MSWLWSRTARRVSGQFSPKFWCSLYITRLARPPYDTSPCGASLAPYNHRPRTTFHSTTSATSQTLLPFHWIIAAQNSEVSLSFAKTPNSRRRMKSSMLSAHQMAHAGVAALEPTLCRSRSRTFEMDRRPMVVQVDESIQSLPPPRSCTIHWRMMAPIHQAFFQQEFEALAPSILGAQPARHAKRGKHDRVPRGSLLARKV